MSRKSKLSSRTIKTPDERSKKQLALIETKMRKHKTDGERQFFATSFTHFWKLHPKMQGVLPEGYDYFVDRYIDGKLEDHFETDVRLSLTTKEEITTWIELFRRKSKFGLLLLRTYPNSNQRYSYKISYKCQFKQDSRVKSMGSYTDCPATLTVALLKTPTKKLRKNDNRIPLMSVHVKYLHNHGIESKFLKRMKVAPDVVEKFRNMFSDGVKPAKAWEIHRDDMQKQHPENYVSVFENRSIVPDKKWCYNFHAKVTKSAKERDRCPSSEDQAQMQKELYEQANRLCQLLSQHPKTLYKPLSHFVTNMKSLTDCQALSSALNSFGNHHQNHENPEMSNTARPVKSESPVLVKSIRRFSPSKFQMNFSDVIDNYSIMNQNLSVRIKNEDAEIDNHLQTRRTKFLHSVPSASDDVADETAIELICMDSHLEHLTHVIT